jgi:hypothetical protein
METAAIDAELADLRRKLAKREDQAGFARNVEALRARISLLEAERAALEPTP